jgi:hypothetical protein
VSMFDCLLKYDQLCWLSISEIACDLGLIRKLK